MVFQNNYGGDSKSFLNSFSFSVRLPVAIPVATRGNDKSEDEKDN